MDKLVPLTLPFHYCRRCAYKWTPRISTRPVECPRCKRRDWDVEKEKAS